MRLTIDDIKKMNIGDKFVAKSDNPNFYVSGLCDGVVLEIADKMNVFTIDTFEPVCAVCVKYTQMKAKTLVENGETKLISNGIPCDEPIVRKLEDNDPVGYWYETIE